MVAPKAGKRNAAPKARNMKARGKREARRPWYNESMPLALKGRNIFRPFRPDYVYCIKPGATRFALAPGFYIPRLWRSAFGAPPVRAFGRFQNCSFNAN